MMALLGESQFVGVEWLTAFGPRFVNESVKFRVRTPVIDDSFPTPVASCKLTELVKHGATLNVIEFWQLLDDFSSAHPGKNNLPGYSSQNRSAAT